METPIVYDMLLVLLKKGEKIRFHHSRLKPKPRIVSNVAIDHKLGVRPSLRVFYVMDNAQTQAWRGLSAHASIDDEAAFRLEQDEQGWILHLDRHVKL